MVYSYPLHEKIIPASPWVVALVDGNIKVFCTQCRESIELETAHQHPTWQCKCKEPVTTAPLLKESLAGPIEILKRRISTQALETYPETLEEAERAADVMIFKYGEGKALLIQLFRLLHEMETHNKNGS